MNNRVGRAQGLHGVRERARKNGSEQKSEKGAILRHFAENKEFSLERCQSLRLQQQVTEILVFSPAA